MHIVPVAPAVDAASKHAPLLLQRRSSSRQTWAPAARPPRARVRQHLIRAPLHRCARASGQNINAFSSCGFGQAKRAHLVRVPLLLSTLWPLLCAGGGATGVVESVKEAAAVRLSLACWPARPPASLPACLPPPTTLLKDLCTPAP